VEFSRIKYTTAKRIARVVLSRPDKHNALDDQMVSELSQAFTHALRDSEVKAVILSAEGESFCSGADLEYLRRVSKFDFNQNLDDSTSLMRLFLLIYTLRKPVIALVSGPALAGGCGLATVCDFILAAKETATFGYPEVRIGFIPAIVTEFLVRRVGEGRARELTLSGEILSAESAERIGLASRVIPAMELEKAGIALAMELTTKNSPSSMGLIKELLARIHGMSTSEALEYAANLNALTRMTDDCKRGVEAFLNKDQVRW
jgi:methylglutaconyl-CoA hydratase